MIAIIDNGNDYSDHCIAFVDGVKDKEVAVALAALTHSGHVVALVEKVTWYKGDLMSLASAASGGYPFEDHPYWIDEDSQEEMAQFDAALALVKLAASL